MRATTVLAVFLTSTALCLTSGATAAIAAEVHPFGGLAMTPAGDRTATIEPVAGGRHGAIVVRSTVDGRIVRTIDPCARCSYSGITFAPDAGLAFLSRDGNTVALSVADGNAVRTVATIAGVASTPRFSPDGTRIALLVTLGAAKEVGATQAGVRQIGEIGEKSDEQRIALFDRAASTPVTDVTPISPADRYVYEYDWTPDGRGFVVSSALGNGDNNWWVATLDAIDAATGAVRPIAKPATQVNMPRISPDGRSVAYIGGLMSDFGSIGGDVWTVPFAGGSPVNRTAGARASVTSLAWTKGGLRATRLMGDAAQVASLAPDGATKVEWSRPASFSAGDGRVGYSADGNIVATVMQDYTHGPAIFAGPIGSPRQITHDNDALVAHVVARSITWRNDGFAVQGWLLSPLGGDRTAKAPLITVVHGGPSAASTPGYVGAGTLAETVGAGYHVFLPNPRGSFGQGEAFTAANKRDFGGGDLRDILTGIDAVEKIAPIDDTRLGLTGGSYGGFMAMWANTQTDRFKAIVASAGLSDWISYYGTNGIDQWMIPFFGKSAYDDPAAYRAVSAITFIKQAKTPTFIYVGERDIEVPPTQSVEYWHALKERGVPTTLVIYPDEGHSIRNPANNADVARRTRAWFDRYLAMPTK